ncbi:MAG: hypothetical protein J7L08_00820 [Candidatus Aenigmarchaeota archaeon]|nr:hypothetical protein [Candidatus Aenigmarchaeota archaeon]
MLPKNKPRTFIINFLVVLSVLIFYDMFISPIIFKPHFNSIRPEVYTSDWIEFYNNRNVSFVGNIKISDGKIFFIPISMKYRYPIVLDFDDRQDFLHNTLKSASEQKLVKINGKVIIGYETDDKIIPTTIYVSGMELVNLP